MTVKELKQIIENIDDNAVVYISIGDGFATTPTKHGIRTSEKYGQELHLTAEEM